MKTFDFNCGLVLFSYFKEKYTELLKMNL